jgi:hypothetical protein
MELLDSSGDEEEEEQGDELITPTTRARSKLIPPRLGMAPPPRIFDSSARGLLVSALHEVP